MSIRYRPSAHVTIIAVLMLGLFMMNVIALQPALEQKRAEVAALEKRQLDITTQMQQRPTDAEQRMLQRAAWSGADWTQAIVDGMANAKNGMPQLEATYALGNPSNAVLAGEEYAAQRLDLEIRAKDDMTIFRFIDRLAETLPGGTHISVLQMQKDAQTNDITAAVSLALYRLVKP